MVETVDVVRGALGGYGDGARVNEDNYSIREVVPYGRTPDFIERVRLAMLQRSGLELLKTFESGKMYTVRMIEERQPVPAFYPVMGRENDTEITFRFDVSEVEVRQHYVMSVSDYPDSLLMRSALSEIKHRIKNWVYFKRLKVENFFRRMKQ